MTTKTEIISLLEMNDVFGFPLAPIKLPNSALEQNIHAV
jgi:hypothetical protein